MGLGRSSNPLPTGRIVVLVQMEDGTVRAFDGQARGHIDVTVDYEPLNPFEPVIPIRPVNRETTITVTYPGVLKMYTSQQPEAPEQEALPESQKAIES